jgi:hypothetical protein
MDGACIMRGGHEEYIQNVSRKIWSKGRTNRMFEVNIKTEINKIRVWTY